MADSALRTAQQAGASRRCWPPAADTHPLLLPARFPACLPAANTGHFVLLPTPGGLSFAAAWSAAAPAMLADNLSEQGSLLALEGKHFASCSTLCKCYSAAHNVSCACLWGAARFQKQLHPGILAFAGPARSS